MLGAAGLLIALSMGVSACSQSGGTAGTSPSGTATGGPTGGTTPTARTPSSEAPSSPKTPSSSKTSASSSADAPKGKTSNSRKSPAATANKTAASAGPSRKASSRTSSTSRSHTHSPPPSGHYDDTSGTGAKAPHDQHKAVDKLPGAKKKKCVAVGKKEDVRSGDIAMGNFVTARKQFNQSKDGYSSEPLSLYIIPTSRKQHGVKVTADQKHGKTRPVEVSSKQMETAAQWKYYPIKIKLPSSGVWRFNVAIGKDRGCFEAKFTS